MLGSLHFSFIVESILGGFHLPHDLMCRHQPNIFVENMPHGPVSNPSQPQVNPNSCFLQQHVVCLSHPQSFREPSMWGFPNHRDTPKSSKSLNNFNIETYGFDWGSPILGNLHIHIYIYIAVTIEYHNRLTTNLEIAFTKSGQPMKLDRRPLYLEVIVLVVTGTGTDISIIYHDLSS